MTVHLSNEDMKQSLASLKEQCLRNNTLRYFEASNSLAKQKLREPLVRYDILWQIKKRNKLFPAQYVQSVSHCQEQRVIICNAWRERTETNGKLHTK
jgi:hypothetical protein